MPLRIVGRLVAPINEQSGSRTHPDKLSRSNVVFHRSVTEVGRLGTAKVDYRPHRSIIPRAGGAGLERSRKLNDLISSTSIHGIKARSSIYSQH